MQYKKILIAVDSSPHSLNAARKGIDLARSLNAEVAIVSVIEMARETATANVGVLTADTRNIGMRLAEDNLELLIDEVPGMEDVTRFLPKGIPKKEIIMIARDWNADLIVMGTHGRTGLSYLILGSVSEYVIKHSAIPVMVVPLH